MAGRSAGRFIPSFVTQDLEKPASRAKMYSRVHAFCFKSAVDTIQREQYWLGIHILEPTWSDVRFVRAGGANLNHGL